MKDERKTEFELALRDFTLAMDALREHISDLGIAYAGACAARVQRAFNADVALRSYERARRARAGRGVGDT